MLLNLVRNNKIILKNTGYLSIIEILRMAMPFIALPYIIQTVGGENYGKAVFAQTIISYFSIFINWGLDISAVKNVSVNRNNSVELNKIISTVLTIKLILFLISFIFLLLCINVVALMNTYKVLLLFAFITCFSEILFPVWFYQGIEKMKFLTIVRTASILFYTIAIFIFIRQPADYEKIVLLQSLSNIVAGFISIYLLFYVNKIKLICPKYSDLKETFYSSFPFFMSRLSVILNNTMAKTISGIFFSMEAVAAFDLAQKIATVSLVPLQMLNQAVYPHIAKTMNRQFAKKFLNINACLSLFIALFVFILAPYAIHFFASEQLDEAVTLLRILCLWIFCGGITSYIGTPILVSFGYPKPFNKSVILSTITLLFLYVLMSSIGIMTIYNFAIALFLSELVILIYRIFYCYKLRIFTINS